jgi:hypothetical protein
MNAKQTITSQQSPNLLRAPAPKNSPMLRSSSCQPNMSNVLADIKRAATSKESDESRRQFAKSAPPSGWKATENMNQQSAQRPSTQRTSPECRDKQENKVDSSEPLKLKYPEDEPKTPERTSPVQPQTVDSEPAQIQPCASETSSPRTPVMSRRDRRERVRSRSVAQSKTNANSQTEAAAVDSVPEEAPTAEQEKPIPTKPSTTPPSSHTNARAAARDRYARHKKMMHQRHATTS